MKIIFLLGIFLFLRILIFMILLRRVGFFLGVLLLLPYTCSGAISTAPELITALNKSVSGDIVYIDDFAEIELTNYSNITIPEGVTLMSGGGKKNGHGALLYDNYSVHDDNCTNVSEKVLFIPGPKTRMTGLRIRGANTQIGNCPFEYTLSDGIKPSSPDVEIDHNEISNFRRAAIFLYELGAEPAYIHDNYIHSNMGDGFGYGVNIENNSNAIIEQNTFDWNRHSIAGSGAFSSYTARRNHILENGTGHAFDMHGTGPDGYGGAAGSIIIIEGNIFSPIHGNMKFGDGDGVNVSHPSIQIIGKPKIGAYIYNNIAPPGSIEQVGTYGNFNIFQ